MTVEKFSGLTRVGASLSGQALRPGLVYQLIHCGVETHLVQLLTVRLTIERAIFLVPETPQIFGKVTRLSIGAAFYRRRCFRRIHIYIVSASGKELSVGLLPFVSPAQPIVTVMANRLAQPQDCPNQLAPRRGSGYISGGCGRFNTKYLQRPTTPLGRKAVFPV